MPTNMWTKVFAASAVIALAGSTLVYAQQSGAPDRSERSRPERYRPSADDLSAFTDARVAAIKAGLRLSTEQEKNWPAFEVAFRNLAKLRTERILALRDPPSPPADMLERLQRSADAAGRSAAALRQAAEATEPLYKSLDDAQKHRFAMLAPMLGQPAGISQPGGNFRRGPMDFRRDGPGSDRFQQRGMDRPRSGPMERIRFDGREVEHDDSGNPGITLARESGWQ